MKREEAKKMIDDGIAALNEALREGRSETLTRFLETISRFYDYSFGNAVLIASQRPDATHVAGFHTWRKLGRFVKKGEHGIGIIAPMVTRKRQASTEANDGDQSNIYGFRIAYVFDVKQTEGKALPEFSSALGDPGQWLELLENSIRDTGIELRNDFIFGGAIGCSMNGCIVVRPDLDPTARFAVLLHEWAHEILHQKANSGRTTTRKIRETEAEAVAHAVCRACGIDSTTRSADYIQLYSGNPETLMASLTFVHQASAEIIAELFKQRKQGELPHVMALSA